MRYIHQNPIKAKITKHVREYSWSSYKQYISAYYGQSCHIDASLLLNYIKKYEDFEEYMNAAGNEDYLEYSPVKKYSDDKMKDILLKDIDISGLKEMSITERNRVIKDIYQSRGVSIRQLARVLGIGKTVVEKALREEDERNVPVSSILYSL